MKGEFVLIVDGKLTTYRDYRDIPEVFDNVIKFKPDFSEGPHTEDEHEMLHLWNDRLQKLMEKERARSNKNR
jgi:hypothetical protein